MGMLYLTDGYASLAAALFWRPSARILMLYAYFDESGEHDPATGRLVDMTLGGCVSSEMSWSALTLEWNEALHAEGVSHFHMADFEARQPPFDGWCERKRRRLLSRLLDVATTHVERFVGFATTPEDAATNSGDWHRFRDTRGAIQALVFYSMIEGILNLTYPCRYGMRIAGGVR